MPQRRALLAAALALPALPRPARAQPFPDKPLRMIVPFAAGTSSDIQGRLIASFMEKTLGQPMVVENRAGGGGTVGAELVAKARPDGHTLLLGSNGPLTVNPVLQPRLPYDVEKELAPIALVSRSPLTVAVKADSPFRSLGELVAAAKAKPGDLTIGSSGQGSATHFLIEQLMAAAGIRLTHVPYRGSSQ
ncbi:tripartite tricarboxylate transporter substrate binding protein, partial [Siccirubricoccus sp. KC 17139]